MKELLFRRIGVFIVSMLLAVLPVMSMALAEEAKSNPPPVSQPLVSEGDLAVKLLFALAVGTTDDQVEAESTLGDVGIAPRNGWIADYPVTPDIVAEVRNAVADAADGKKISLRRDEALKRYDDAVAELGLVVRSYSGESAVGKPVSCANYPNPAVITTTYTNEGPPIVTYYCPPPDYYYLYTWVPYPFWWTDFWFPGFFVLNDFHRVVFVHNHVVRFTNHFNDFRGHRVFRIDPAERFRGRTFAGIGVRNPRDFITTGVPRSSHTIFNGPRGTSFRGVAPAGRGVPAVRGGSARPPAAPAVRGGGSGSGGGMRGGSGGGPRR
ncbi:MAG TPA: hypothetical protein VIU40_14685 [Geobacteraceae bacterium]